MNLDLLKKLIRLANNNPNDNEANSAARRVCKMLEEDNFKCFKIMYLKEELKIDPVGNVPYDSIINDLRKKAAQQQKEGSWTGFNWDPKYETPEYKQTSSTADKPKKTLKCTRCGNMVETKFVGPSQIYVCNVCQWKEYMKDFNP